MIDVFVSNAEKLDDSPSSIGLFLCYMYKTITLYCRSFEAYISTGRAGKKLYKISQFRTLIHKKSF